MLDESVSFFPLSRAEVLIPRYVKMLTKKNLTFSYLMQSLETSFDEVLGVQNQEQEFLRVLMAALPHETSRSTAQDRSSYGNQPGNHGRDC